MAKISIIALGLRGIFTSDKIKLSIAEISVMCIPLIAKIWLMPRREKSRRTPLSILASFPSKSAEKMEAVSKFRLLS